MIKKAKNQFYNFQNKILKYTLKVTNERIILLEIENRKLRELLEKTK